jgi:phage gp36-like protein
MAYCTQDDLLKMISQEELAELTAEFGDAPDSQVVAEAISRGQAEIDAYLGTVYKVPLTPVPALIKALAVDLALFHLYARRSAVPPVRQQKYEAALAFLKEVAAGQATVATGSEPSTTGRQAADLGGATRLFRRDTLGEW